MRKNPPATRTLAAHGFTLIELLIVVAIIAILAAIAVPNFLEAQVRAKVSRTQSDLRTLVVGLESYRTDTNRLPPVVSQADTLTGRLSPLTTPVSFLTTIPSDPFWVYKTSPSLFVLGGKDPAYAYAPGNLRPGSNVFNAPEYRNQLYSLAGRGPDSLFQVGGYCMAHPDSLKDDLHILNSYDPTNGTVSPGDILRLGQGSLGGR